MKSLPSALHWAMRRRANVRNASRAIVSICGQITEDSDDSENSIVFYTVRFLNGDVESC